MKFKTTKGSYTEIKEEFIKKHPNITPRGFYCTDINDIVNIFTDDCPIDEDESCFDCYLKGEKGVCQNDE